MIFRSFRFLPKSFLGIDIGTSSLKIVELSRWGERISLKNYAEIKASALYDKPFRTFEKNTLLLSGEDVARAIRGMIQEAKIQTKKAVFSIPDFSSFFTNFELPKMTKEELPEAVQYEARKHIPIPLSEVTFDWQIVDGIFQETRPSKVLLVAVPNEVINQYQEISRLAGVELAAMEAEVFGLIRSTLHEEKRVCILLDIGAQSTTINVVSKGVLRVSHSIDIAGNSLTERISQSLGIDEHAAEQEKITKGVLPSSGAYNILAPLLDVILMETERIGQAFLQTEQKEIEKIFIGGGAAKLAGIKEYFEQSTKKEIEIADPFRTVFYPPILEDTLKDIGSSYAVAVGVAMRELQ